MPSAAPRAPKQPPAPLPGPHKRPAQGRSRHLVRRVLDATARLLEERIRSVVDWFLAAHAASPALHRSLTEAAAPVLGVTRIREMERAFHRTVLEALRPYAAEIRRPDLALAAFVVAQTLEGLTHSAVVHHPELLEGERLRREISDLLLGYLRGRDAGPPPRRGRARGGRA